ncbi:hypothetical protein RFI_02013 [Reticulomyxa filosa]|uniref:Protein kinase domain-containing protein n=1 Tax=Reticulomyxa filosa TaxID=46433 RepID=X6P953_RETFI|nr:hypothetical protein RFI_02013 [Reticulomyxa filosa]|eukprot:ETO35060.1 hypothetical protein RFI_02013 [Reticulomyxa filosa]
MLLYLCHIEEILAAHATLKECAFFTRNDSHDKNWNGLFYFFQNLQKGFEQNYSYCYIIPMFKPTILSVENIRNRLVQLYTAHDPSQLDFVDENLKKWKGKENELLKSLCDQYKEPFTNINPVGIKEQYSIGVKLGTPKQTNKKTSGGFAVVRKCKEKSTNIMYALKIINKKNLDKGDLVTLEKEVSIMRQVHHDNIVKLHNVFDSKSKMCLVLDLLEGGELFDRIIDHGHFTEKNAAQCFGQLIIALEYLHERQIVHRDLKPENLLFVNKCKNKDVFVEGEWNMKLIDFGLAGSLKSGPLKTPCGTPNYVAPEILRKENMVPRWICGPLVLCGFPPFYDENEDMTRLYRQIKEARYDMPSPHWDGVSDIAKDLVKKLLITDPAKRLTSSQAASHPWLRGKASDQKMGTERVLQLKRFQHVRKLRVKSIFCLVIFCAEHNHSVCCFNREEFAVYWLC